MEGTDTASRVAADTDDVLATISLVRENAQLTGRLFDQLVDLLLEGILAELRADLARGACTPGEYGAELASLSRQCHDVGLLGSRRS